MSKYKTFIAGVIVGSIMVSAVTYASDGQQITATFPNLQYWLDGKLLPIGQPNAKAMSLKGTPDTIQYKGNNYVSVREFANALDKEVTWNQARNVVELRTITNHPFTKVDLSALPAKVGAWVGNAKKIEGAQLAIIDGHVYLLVTRGEQPSAGYGVHIQAIKQYSTYTQIQVEFDNPPKGVASIQPIAYPYDLVELDHYLYGGIKVVDQKGESIPLISGSDPLPPIRAYSANLALFDPVVADGKLTLSGLARDFEGLVYYEWFGPDGASLAKGTLQAQGADPNWGDFQKQWPADSFPSGSYAEIHALVPGGIGPSNKIRIDLPSA